jgi:heme exporter protein C
MTGTSRNTMALRVTGLLLMVCTALWAFFVWRAPIDATQGPIQKILYVHVPVVLGAYLGFALTALGSGLYLARREERYDRFAAAAAEVGVFFATLVMITGPLWAKGTWGRWWTWDLRLTLTLLLYLIYVSYLLLRSFTEGNERAARFGAVYAIAGLAVIPLNYFAIDLAGGRTVHPENLGRGSLGEGMGAPFAIGMLTAVAAFAHLLVRRLEVGSLQAALDERALTDPPEDS